MSSRQLVPSVFLSSVSPARKKLLGLIQKINFGRIERLPVRGGEPVLDPLPAVVAEVKFAGENGPRAEAGLGDFILKKQHLDLFALDEVPGPPDPDPFAGEAAAAALAGLSPEDRVIVERLLTGTSKSALAVDLGVGRATVYRRLRAIRDRLAGEDL